MNDAVFAHLDKVLHLPFLVDELHALNSSISTYAVFEPGMQSVASERETWLDHPRDAFGMCEGKTLRASITGASS